MEKSANNAPPPPGRPVSRAWREERGNSPGIMQPCGARRGGTHAPEGEGEGGGDGEHPRRGKPAPSRLPAARLRGEGGGEQRESGTLSPDRTKRREAREGEARRQGGDKPGPPAPTAPPDRLHLSPATAEGGKETPRRRLRSSQRESGVLTLPAPPAGTATASRSPALRGARPGGAAAAQQRRRPAPCPPGTTSQRRRRLRKADGRHRQ